MYVASKDFMVSTPGGNLMTFELPVTRKMNKDEKLLHALRHIFKISEKQALELSENKDDESKWGWAKNGFKETTDAELNRGYEYVSVPVQDYEKIITLFKSKNDNHGEPIEPRIKESIADIEQFGKIYRLKKKIEIFQKKVKL